MERVRIDDVENDVQPAAVMRQLTEPLGLTDLAINYYELEPGDSFAFAYHSHAVQEEVFVVLEGTAVFETGEARSASEPASSAERSHSRDGEAVSRDDENSPWEFSNHAADRSSGRRGGETTSNETVNPSRGPRKDGGTARKEGTVEVGPGEAVRFDRGEFQRGWNRGGERVVALALGAPLEYGEQVKLRDCPDCGEATDNRLERVDVDGEEAVVAYCKECGAETGRWYRGPMDGTVP